MPPLTAKGMRLLGLRRNNGALLLEAKRCHKCVHSLEGRDVQELSLRQIAVEGALLRGQETPRFVISDVLESIREAANRAFVKKAATLILCDTTLILTAIRTQWTEEPDDESLQAFWRAWKALPHLRVPTLVSCLPGTLPIETFEWLGEGRLFARN